MQIDDANERILDAGCSDGAVKRLAADAQRPTRRAAGALDRPLQRVALDAPPQVRGNDARQRQAGGRTSRDWRRVRELVFADDELAFTIGLDRRSVAG